jgi:hypothetical protein
MPRQTLARNALWVLSSSNLTLRKATLLRIWPPQWYWLGDTLTSVGTWFLLLILRDCDLLNSQTKTLSAADRVL